MDTIDGVFSTKEWNTYLDENPHATVYHTLEWRSILEDVFHYKTSYTVCRNGRADVVGILPIALVRSWMTGNRAVSLPFSQYGGPLANDSTALEHLLKYLRKHLKDGFEYVRLRARDRLDDNVVARVGMRLSEDCSRCYIPLGNRTVDDIQKSLHSGCRRAIKQSSRYNVHVRVSDEWDDLNRVNHLIVQTCKKHGTPPYPSSLLKAISDLLVPRGIAKIFIATLEQKIIGTLVLLTMKNEATYAYVFTDPKYLRLRTNNALLWTAIRWSLESGMSCFDMGISSPLDNELLRFKKSWGATEEKLHDYFILEGQKPLNPDRRSSLTYKLAILTWRLVFPTFVASKVGPRLLYHFG